MLPLNLPSTISTLSQDRIKSYKSYFGLTTDEEAFGLYLWNDQLSASFFKLVSILEVTLRNALHRELSREYYQFRTQGSAFDNDWYEHLINTNVITDYGTIKQIRETTHRTQKNQYKPKQGIKPGDVIAAQTFGFWHKLLEKNKRIQWQNILYHSLKDHFRLHPTYWSQQAIDDLLIRLQEVNTLRNRIAHHEPIWKFKGKTHHKTHVPIYQSATTPSDSISQMKVLNERLVRLLSWFSEDRKNDYLLSHYKRHFDWLVRVETIDIYKTLKPVKKMTLSAAKRELKSVLTNREFMEISHKDNCATIIVGPI